MRLSPLLAFSLVLPAALGADDVTSIEIDGRRFGAGAKDTTCTTTRMGPKVEG